MNLERNWPSAAVGMDERHSDIGRGSRLRFYCPNAAPVGRLKGTNVLFDLLPFRAKLRKDSCDIHEVSLPALFADTGSRLLRLPGYNLSHLLFLRLFKIDHPGRYCPYATAWSDFKGHGPQRPSLTSLMHLLEPRRSIG